MKKETKQGQKQIRAKPQGRLQKSCFCDFETILSTPVRKFDSTEQRKEENHQK